MDISFYNIEGDETYRAIGITTASPEEHQVYAKALPKEIPADSALVVRERKTPQGRREIIIGIAKVGQPLVLAGESEGTVKALPPTPAPKAIEVPKSIKEATEENLEVMAARAGVKVDANWKRKSRPIRELDVAERQQKLNAVGV